MSKETSKDMTLIQKLAELRKRVQGFVKDTKGYNYQYFDINQMIEKIQPVCEELGIMIIQPIDGQYTLYLHFYDLETGEEKRMGGMQLPDVQDPQKMGSAITYYRRYMLQSALFWGAVDDDGAGAKPDYKAELEDLIVRHSVDESKLLEAYGVKSIAEMTDIMASDAVNKLKKKYE